MAPRGARQRVLLLFHHPSDSLGDSIAQEFSDDEGDDSVVSETDGSFSSSSSSSFSLNACNVECNICNIQKLTRTLICVGSSSCL